MTWFREKQQLWKGQQMSLEIEEMLYQGKSKYQEIEIFQSTTYGRVLVLDGVIQCTEKDECSYQEMLAHLAMQAHPNPTKILVIGGGDGGIIREILKYKQATDIHICEIDAVVIDKCKEFIPSMAHSFDDPKVNIHIRDGFEFLNENIDEFDVIVTDSSDPVGPAESLYQATYFDLVYRSLKSDGVFTMQGECMWLHTKLIKKCMDDLRHSRFKQVEYAWTSVPTYPCGTIGFLVACKSGLSNVKVPQQSCDDMQLKFYSSELHTASFVKPKFVEEALRQ
eukprot:NODE_28_length_33831_cov_0.361200.p9 type:complete len:280 gc:universal NODE_28_length_33831_cov_0.361200:29220-30059(+)